MFTQVGLSPLLNLVKYMHFTDQRLLIALGHAHQGARAMGETYQQLYMLSECMASLFYAPQRAVLIWTEAVTHIADGVSDELYEGASVASPKGSR